MNRNFNISAGHTSVKGKDNGASANGFIEGYEMEEFRNLLVNELRKYNIECKVDGNNTTIADTIKYFMGIVKSSDIIIDLHLNSSTNPLATGTEIIIPTNPSKIERELATKLSVYISQILGLKNRGVKTTAELGRKLSFFSIPGENILIEFAFISNFNDMKKYTENKETLAKGIAKILSEYKSI